MHYFQKHQDEWIFIIIIAQACPPTTAYWSPRAVRELPDGSIRASSARIPLTLVPNQANLKFPLFLVACFFRKNINLPLNKRGIIEKFGCPAHECIYRSLKARQYLIHTFHYNSWRIMTSSFTWSQLPSPYSAQAHSVIQIGLLPKLECMSFT